MTLNLTLKSSPKVKIFEISIRKTNQNILGYYAQGIINLGEVKGQSQGRAKRQIHLIGYNFGSNCHRDFKLVSLFLFMKSCTKYDLDLEQFAKVKILATPIKEN